MENFLLGIFSEQLSKFIVGFRKEQVNANLLTGKGEITDVELNVATLNKYLVHYMPYIQLESAHLTKLSFNVTSFTNIKKAPIEIAIDEIHVTILEPLSFSDSTNSAKPQIVAIPFITQLTTERGQYGLFDRIVDNVTIEIDRIYIRFQTLGKFKTRRVGPWTPPAVTCVLSNVRYVSVDEFGEENTPENIWSHNTREARKIPDQRHRHRYTVMIYKKLSMESSLSVGNCEEGMSTKQAFFNSRPLLRNLPLVIHIAFHKRVRDAAILAVQMDISLLHVEVEIDAETLPLLVHCAAGIHHCVVKDRSFEDPLVSKQEAQKMMAKKEGERRLRVRNQHLTISHVATISQDEGVEQSFCAVDDVHQEGGDTLEIVRNSDEESMEDEDDDSQNDDNSAANSIGWNMAAQQSEDMTSLPFCSQLNPRKEGSIHRSHSLMSQKSAVSAGRTGNLKTSPRETLKSKPLVTTAVGLIIYERICFILSLKRFIIRAKYHPKVGGYLQLTLNSIGAEFTWPKTIGEAGCCLQMSMSLLTLQEKHNKALRTVMAGGKRQDFLSRMANGIMTSVQSKNDAFPTFGYLSIRDDCFGTIGALPIQSFGLKVTTNDSKYENRWHFKYEVGVNGVELNLDADFLNRFASFCLNEEGGGYDVRWYSGEWIDQITREMLAEHYDERDFHSFLQPIRESNTGGTCVISSDFTAVTAKFKNVHLRIPAPLHDDLRSSDVLVSLPETTLIVSSSLPRSSLFGRVQDGTATKDQPSEKNTNAIMFPDDKSDLCFNCPVDIPTESHSNASKFRFQISVVNTSVQIVPAVPFLSALEPQWLLAPTSLSILLSFEGALFLEPENLVLDSALYFSGIVDGVEVNLDFGIFSSAIGTISYHAHRLLYSTTSFSTPSISDTPLMSDKPGTLSYKINRLELTSRSGFFQKRLMRVCEKGGLAISVCMHIDSVDFRFWRQNVPLGANIEPLILLFRTRLVEIGISADIVSTHTGDKKEVESRAVIKLCLSGANVFICDTDATQTQLGQQNHDYLGSSDSDSGNSKSKNFESHSHFTRLAELLTLGGSNIESRASCSSKPTNAIAIRFDHQKRQLHECCAAVELAAGATCYLMPENLEAFIEMVIEAFLLPAGKYSATSSVCEVGVSTEFLMRSAIFPEGCVGSMLECYFRSFANTTACSNDTEELSCKSCLSSFFSIFAVKPHAIDKVLMRASTREMIAVIPNARSKGSCPKERDIVLFLDKVDLILGFVSGLNTSKYGSATGTWSGNNQDWTTHINDSAPGFHSNISLELSVSQVNSTSFARQHTVDDIVIVPQFSMNVYYHPTKIQGTFGPCQFELGVPCQLDEVYRTIITLSSTWAVLLRRISFMLSPIIPLLQRNLPSSIERSGNAETTNSITNYDSGTFNAASNAPIVAIQKTRSLITEISQLLASHDHWVFSTFSRIRDEMDRARELVFLKERERVAAYALVSSRASGWLRIGRRSCNGQRITTNTALLRQWVFLFKSEMLFIYDRPGQAGESEVILLADCQIRSLVGGWKKLDLKRSFALITGRQEILCLCDNLKDYDMWVREISRAVITSQRKSRLSNLTQDNTFTSAALSSIPVDAVGYESKGTNQDLQMAKVATKETSPARRGGEEDDFGMPVTVLDMANPSPVFSEEKSESGCLEDLPNSPKGGRSSGIGWQANISTQKKEQMKQRFSTIKSSTKSKLGAAIQVTRQNLAGIAEQRKQNETFIQCSSSAHQIEPLISAAKNAKLSGSDAHSTQLKNPTGVLDYQPKKIETEFPFDYKQLTQGQQQLRLISSNAEDRGHESNDEHFERDPVAPIKAEAVSSRDDNLEKDLGTGLETGDDSLSLAEELHLTSNLALGEKEENNNLVLGTRSNSLRSRMSRIGAVVKTVKLDGKALTQLKTSAFQNPKKSENTSERSEVGSEPGDMDGSNISSRSQATAVSSRSGLAGRGHSQETLRGRNDVETGDFLVRPKSIMVSENEPCLKEEIPNIHFNSGSFQTIPGVWTVSVAVSDSLSETGPLQNNAKYSHQYVSSEHRNSLNEEINAKQIAAPDHCLPPTLTLLNTESKSPSLICLFQPICVQWNADGSKPLIEQISRSFAEFLHFHAFISEHLSKIDLTDVFDVESTAVTNQTRISRCVSQVDMTGKVLHGISKCVLQIPIKPPLIDALCNIGSNFLNALLECPLPKEVCMEVIHFLGMHCVVDYLDFLEASDTFDWWSSNQIFSDGSLSQKMLSLAASCDSELTKVECEWLMSKSDLTQNIPAHIQLSKNNCFSVMPSLLLENTHAALHKALLKTVIERDELHAQLIATSVLHVHEMEQERKKVERITKKLECAEHRLKTAAAGGGLFSSVQDEQSERIRMTKMEKKMIYDSDAGLLEMCRQLSSEISARTLAELEVSRLKESRKMEIESEAALRATLLAEVAFYKEKADEEKRHTKEINRHINKN